MNQLKLLDAIYVVHAKNGYEMHEARIYSLFKQYQLEFEFVTDGDPSFFTDELLNTYFVPDIKSRLSDGTLSCTLNHILSYQKMIKADVQFAIIFENDPFFLKDFIRNLNLILEEARSLKPGFIISLENTTLKFPPRYLIQKNQYLYKASSGRCAGAYLMDKQAALNMMNDLKLNKCDQVIDWWHNRMIDDKVFEMYWAHPPIVEQGSHNGQMSSTISSKNKNIRRRISWILQKTFKTWRHRLS